MVSAIAWKKPTTCARRSASIRVSAKPKNNANTTSGSIALCAAAAIALLGMIAVIASAQPVGAVGAAVAVPRVAQGFGQRRVVRSIDSKAGAASAVNAPLR